MPAFVKGGAARTPFGKNAYLRSTQDVKTESYTISAATVPSATIDGNTEKVLQPGTVLAKITSGSEAGKVGPYQASGTNEVQTLTPSGTISGGTFTLTYGGQTTTALAYNANAAAVRAALEALNNIEAGDVTVTGGPLSSGAFTITFIGLEGGQDVPQLTFNSSLTGSTPAVAVATGTPGVAGATDGRQTAANIVGLCDTFLPWQLLERDVEVAVAYQCTAVQGWCFELNAAGQRIALTDTTADAMRGTKGLQVNFK